jgi:hypothetical protein
MEYFRSRVFPVLFVHERMGGRSRMWKFSSTRGIFPAATSSVIAANSRNPCRSRQAHGLLSGASEASMTRVHEFIHRHYSPEVGESPAGHAVAVVAGLLLMAIGAALVVSIVFLPAGIAIGTLGVLLFGAGIFAHIMSPLSVSDLMDAIVGLSGAAVTLTIAIAIAVMAVGFAITVLVSLFRWIAS